VTATIKLRPLTSGYVGFVDDSLGYITLSTVNKASLCMWYIRIRTQTFLYSKFAKKDVRMEKM
jgi:hypothetical protein